MKRTSIAAVLRTVRLAAAGAAVVLVAPVLAGGTSVLPDVGALLQDDAAPVVASDTPGVARRAAALVVEHDCWTGEAPADVVTPGHVVVTLRRDDRLVTRYGGARLTGRALEHVFGEPDPQVLVVHGFCR